MSDILNVLGIAEKWREDHPEHATKGIVMIWNGQAYGWKDSLRDAHGERPGVIAVDVREHIFVAEGGNDYDGAKCWVVKN